MIVKLVLASYHLEYMININIKHNSKAESKMKTLLMVAVLGIALSVTSTLILADNNNTGKTIYKDDSTFGYNIYAVTTASSHYSKLKKTIEISGITVIKNDKASGQYYLLMNNSQKETMEMQTFTTSIILTNNIPT